MRLVNLPGVLLGITGLCALSGAVAAQGYSEWAGGYPGWSEAYPYPYTPSYGYGSAYAPGYPSYPSYPSMSPAAPPYPGDPQTGGDAAWTEPPYDPGISGLSEEELAALRAQRAEVRARFEERRRAMQAQHEALRAAIEKRHVEARRESNAVNAGQPHALDPQSGARAKGATDEGKLTPSEESLPQGGGDHLGSKARINEAADLPPMGSRVPSRPTPEQRRAALEQRRQAIQQRREQMKAVFEERRRAAYAPVPTPEEPAGGAMPSSSAVEEPGSGDADVGDVAGTVEKRRAEGEPAPLGLGLQAPEPEAAQPPPEPEEAARAED